VDEGMVVESPSISLRAIHVHRDKYYYRVEGGEEEEEGEERKERGALSYEGEGQVVGETAYVQLSDQWLF